MPSTIESSHGGSGGSGGGNFTFAGDAFKITSLSVDATAPQVDVTHLGIAVGEKRIFKKAPLSDSPEVKIDFIGNTLPAVGTKEDFVLTGEFGSTKASLCTKAVCTSASVKAALGDIIKGSASFKLSKE
jgi:hypothetical protein